MKKKYGHNITLRFKDKELAIIKEIQFYDIPKLSLNQLVIKLLHEYREKQKALV